MRKNLTWLVAVGTALGVATLMTVGAGASSPRQPAAVVHLSAHSARSVRVAHTSGDTAAADQAAIAYVNANDAGSATANVLSTVADVEAGVPVYDIRIVAPNGSTYVVHVQQSNDVVLSVNFAESQSTPPPVTPPVSAPVVVPPGIVPTVIAPTSTSEIESEIGDATEVAGANSVSGDSQSINGSSSDGSTNTSASTTSTSGDGSSATPASSTSTDNQSSTSTTSGSSDSSGASSSSSSDN